MQQALYFRGAALAGDLVAQLGLVICTAFWSFEEPFSHDDIFKVRNFDKTSQRQTKKKKIILSPHLHLKNLACILKPFIDSQEIKPNVAHTLYKKYNVR